MPTMIGYDSENYVMVMEDLGTGSDYSSLYKKDVETTVKRLIPRIDYLSKLHNHTFFWRNDY
jgi:hypothetical protein